MSYWISLKHGFDTKEMVEKRINPDLVYAADKLALAREFESKGDSEAGEKATRQGIKSLMRVADNPGIQSLERGYAADLFEAIPDRFIGIALDEMRGCISTDILPRINSVGFLTVSRFVSTIGIITPSVFIPMIYRGVCQDTHYSYPTALLQRDLELPFHYVQRTIRISVELLAV